MSIQEQLIKPVQKWAYNGIEYDSEDDACIAAIRTKLDLAPDEKLNQNIRAHARELVGLLQKIAGPAVRPRSDGFPGTTM